MYDFERLKPREMGKLVSKMIKEHPEVKVCYKMVALLWMSNGYTYTEVSRGLHIQERSLQRWVKLFEEKGIDGLENIQKGRPVGSKNKKDLKKVQKKPADIQDKVTWEGEDEDESLRPKNLPERDTNPELRPGKLSDAAIVAKEKKRQADEEAENKKFEQMADDLGGDPFEEQEENPYNQ